VRNRNASVFLQVTAICLLIIATFLAIYSLISYSRQRNNYPLGMTIGGVPVGGLDARGASQRVLQVYNMPLEIRYGGGVIQVDPPVIGFQLDVDSMLAAADLGRTGGNFWGGFWDYLWNRDPTANAVPLRATISEERLRAYLQTEISPRYDQPATPAQPIPGSTSFTPGVPGQSLDMESAVPLIEDALRSPTNRSVTLSGVRNAAAARPTLKNLEILMKQIVTTSGFDGLIGMYMLDLQNGQEIHFALNQGQEIPVNRDIAFTAASTIKIPILVSYFIQHGTKPVDTLVAAELTNMIHVSDNNATDAVMRELDPVNGPLVVTNNMKKIGLQNTFIAGFFFAGAPQLQRFSTPANQRTDISTEPDSYNQTTPSDMGMLLEDIYQCSATGGGALVAAFPDKINQAVCKQIVDYLAADKLAILIQGGVPEGTTVAHKHGWVTDPATGLDHDWSDAGIVYTPGGNFVLTLYAYHPVQIIFENRAPGAVQLPSYANQLFPHLTQAVYNYFNTSQ
jgi:beta-lactamase class A